MDINKERKFYIDSSLQSDDCWLNAKDNYNTQIRSYTLYNNDSSKETNESGSLPTVFADHINLLGRPGYGLADDYLIDVYSSLRNDEAAVTRDRCPVQLYTRIFKGGPRLRGQPGDINAELDLVSGSDTRSLLSVNSVKGERNNDMMCHNKTIMEQTTNVLPPVLDFVKDMQNPDNIISSWTRGGEDTRSYVNKVRYSRGKKMYE